ncbi:YtxH domain-containing protein [Baaleninema simplex]|uniref:YtxH domain-containing protein n=1 Tax=Baaleninema simplex TaxID=2862350 RepID=UPI000349E020|nr:YtxH domain-containing protein [Baaleninema simplex]
MPNNRTGAFIGGVLLGGVVGAVTGVLLAPRSGRETRKLLKKSARAMPDLAEDLTSNVQLQADRLSESALRNWEDTLARLREAVSAGIAASQAATRDDESETSEPPADSPNSQPSVLSDRST